MHEYDIVIVGGGLVGGSLACALSATGLRTAVIEAAAAAAPQHPSYDERVIALALSSQRIFAGIGLWPALAASAEPILRVHVSERGRPGCTRLDASDEGVPALGYVAPARAIGAAIMAHLQAAPTVELLRPARLVGLHPAPARTLARPAAMQLEVSVGGHARLLRTRLVVAADGGDSAVRRRLGLAVTERGYDQDALITTVTASAPRPGVAFERFTDSGPLALLPMTEGRWSVVWTTRRALTPALLALDDASFLARLQARFGQRLGTLSRPGRRGAYPLRLMLARELTRPRLVLIGNAAHTLHPVAGQGFNLGLRDVAELAEALALAERLGQDPGGPEVLAHYRRRRRGDQQQVALLTDGLARLFVNPWAPVRLARSVGLVGLDLLPGARHRLARRFMGIGGPSPRLARGLPLV